MSRIPGPHSPSPTHSNASYGGGARAGRLSGRGAASQTANGAASRSASIPAAVAKQSKQRVPGAEEFPSVIWFSWLPLRRLYQAAGWSTATSRLQHRFFLSQRTRPTPQPAKPVVSAAVSRAGVRGATGQDVVRQFICSSELYVIISALLPHELTADINHYRASPPNQTVMRW